VVSWSLATDTKSLLNSDGLAKLKIVWEKLIAFKSFKKFINGKKTLHQKNSVKDN
jgi:hypothetical protein